MTETVVPTADDISRALVEAVEITRTGDHDTYITYSTILDIHLSQLRKVRSGDQNTVLSALEDLFTYTENDDLVEAIGWDVIFMLLPFIGNKATRENAVKLLDIVVTKGNSKEVFLKCTEALNGVQWERTYEDDEDEGEATLAEELENMNFEDFPIDTVAQTIELYKATQKVFKRIKTKNPARFLTTFGAALLTSLTGAYQTVFDSKKLSALDDLMLEFISFFLNLYQSEKGGEITSVLQAVLTHYIPIYLGNQLLFWSGRHWEKSHPVFSRRPKSEDLVNVQLGDGIKKYFVLVEQLDMTASVLYSHLFLDLGHDELEPELVYPEGDSFIPISPLGCLLLLAASYTFSPTEIETLFQSQESSKLLKLHQDLVAEYLDGAALNVTDAILLLGMLLEPHLTERNIPSFKDPQNLETSEFLEYLQRISASAAICPSENLRPLLYAFVEQLLNKCPEEGRLYFILDTLDHCPYDNLKVAAIGTLKAQLSSAKTNSLFASPEILNEIGPRLFQLPSEVLEDEEEALDKASFIIECLTLYRLLLLKKEDKSPAQITRIRSSFLVPLWKAVEKWLETQQKDASEENEDKILTWRIVVENLDRIDETTRTFMPY